MKSFIRAFFYPEPYSFTYDLPAEVLREQLRSVFDRKFRFFDECDITGDFDTEMSFWMRLNSGGAGRPGGTIVNGEITADAEGRTVVILRPKVSFGLYLFFFLIPISSLCALFSDKEMTPNNWTGIIFGLFVVPIILVKIPQVGAESLKERYLIYIHRPLKKKHQQ